jgi:ATP-dependent phosphoenolpyruvate carboxykinase
MHYEFDPVDTIQDFKETLCEMRKDLVLLTAIQSVLDGDIQPELIHLTKDQAIAHFLSLYQAGIQNNASECDLFVRRIENWLNEAIAVIPTAKKAA